MSIKQILTPKETEEVKPNLFIQKTKWGYRQVYPSVWKGKLLWKNFLLGGQPIKNTIWFILILFLIFAYKHDIEVYEELNQKIKDNPYQFCMGITNITQKEGYNEFGIPQLNISIINDYEE